jgi:hypothetical protein
VHGDGGEAAIEAAGGILQEDKLSFSYLECTSSSTLASHCWSYSEIKTWLGKIGSSRVGDGFILFFVFREDILTRT